MCEMEEKEKGDAKEERVICEREDQIHSANVSDNWITVRRRERESRGKHKKRKK